MMTPSVHAVFKDNSDLTVFRQERPAASKPRVVPKLARFRSLAFTSSHLNASSQGEEDLEGSGLGSAEGVEGSDPCPRPGEGPSEDGVSAEGIADRGKKAKKVGRQV